MQVGGGQGYKAEINVTPLVDVVLVLLIIFMVVTPMLQSGKAVELPQAKHVAEQQSNREQVLITLTAEKALYYDDQQVTRDEMQQRIKDRMYYNPGLEVFIKGDRRLDYDSVRAVMMACREAGARSVVLATKERKDPDEDKEERATGSR